MAAFRPSIFLDLPAALERELFTDDLRARLNELGELRRSSDPAVRAVDRLASDIAVTGWGSQPFAPRRDPAHRLRFAVHSAGTVRSIVPKSLIEEGVRVSQAASGMAVSVAELALYFTISLLRDLHRTDREMVLGRWGGATSFGVGRTVAGARIGVLGASRVGRAYLRLVVAAGAEVTVYDPYLSDAEAAGLGVALAPLEDVLASSEVVAVHAPVTKETRRMLDQERLALIQDDGIIVNTARSALFDTSALIQELRSGRLSAGLDVFDTEPLPAQDELWGLPNVMLTPHVGAATMHSRHMQGRIVVDEIERFVKGEPLKAEISPKDYDLLA